VEITLSIHPTLGDMFVFVRDLTEIKALESERARSEEVIRDLAFRDPLTQLPNRRLLSDRLRLELARARRSGGYGALMFIDMDNFKQLNDSLGHDMGDELLVQVAQRLTDCIRLSDTVARMGGDEFVVMLCALDSTAEESARLARQVGEKILACLNRPYQLGVHAYLSTPSIGMTLFLDDSEAVDAIFRRADRAMYQVKRSGRNALCFLEGSVTSRN
jgi:diguanylate cyclase (GGDEF)-like protein